jgi:hypothetical protein
MSVLTSSLRFAVIATVLAPVAATAQQTTPDPTQILQPTDFQIRVSKPDGEGWAFITSDVEKERYFNRARCQCKSPVRFTADLTQAGSAKGRAAAAKGNVELLIGGNDCTSSDITTFNNKKCVSLRKTRLTDLAANGVIADTDVSVLFGAPNIQNGVGCAVQNPQYVWLLIDIDEDGYPDMTFANMTAPKLLLALDGQAPPAPSTVTVTPGNEALHLSWSTDSLVDDRAGYVVFCSRAGLPVFSKSYYAGTEFFTRQTECGPKVQAQQTWPPVTAADPPPAKVEIPAPDEIAQLDTRFVCSDLVTTSNEWRIKGLQNDIKYMVGVASVDIRGNASPITSVVVQAPVPTKDFYRGYRDAGGAATGCAYGARARSGGVALVALMLLAMVRLRRRP